MSKSLNLAPLFLPIDRIIDIQTIQSILLTLEEEQTAYKRLLKELDELKNQLNLWDKLNPFSERDLKGAILKVKIELEDLAALYNADITRIKEMTTEAILTVDAFQSRFLMIKLIKKIKKIDVATSGAKWITGRKKALKAADEVGKSFEKIFGDLYILCPALDILLDAYMNYLLEPFHLPHQLDE